MIWVLFRIKVIGPTPTHFYANAAESKYFINQKEPKAITKLYGLDMVGVIYF